MDKIKKQAFFSTIVLVVFFVGISISFLLYNLTKNSNEESYKKEFSSLVNRTYSSVQREIDMDLQVLDSLRSFYNSSENVTRDEFKTFTKHSLEIHKSIQALEWIPLVKDEFKDDFEKRASSELKLNFQFKEKSKSGQMVPVKKREQYYPVYFLEPLEGNLKALGFDLASSKTRLDSINKSINNVMDTATSKITLVQEKEKQLGILVFVPIWKNNDLNRLEGFIIGVYRVGDIINKAFALDKVDASMINMSVIDISNKNKTDLLFTNIKDKNIVKSENFFDLKIKDRVWRLYAQPNQRFFKKTESLSHIIIFLLGVFVTCLISYITALKVSRESDLKELVQEKIRDLHEANQKYESLLEMFDSKVIASKTDLKGKITYVSEAFCKISGYSKEELMGRNHNIVRHEDMPKELYVNLWQTIKQGGTFKGDIKNRKKNGDYYWVDVQIEPGYDSNNKLIGYSAVREDITAKKQIEEFNKTLANKIELAVEDISKKDKLLLQQSKLAAMGEMIGAIAHQWRQPLNTLAIKIQFLEDDFEDGLINEVYLEEYSNENMRLINFMSKTIDDFRNFFTIDKDQIKFSVKDRIEETTNMLKAQFENSNINLTINGDDFYVIGFANEFQQVILNIVNNAKDVFVEKEFESGEINIVLETKEDKGFIKISDNAGGIPEDIIIRIFEPYFTTKEQGKGTGLGLYMSKMIIEDNMDGKINVENIENGVEFIVELGVLNE